MCVLLQPTSCSGSSDPGLAAGTWWSWGQGPNNKWVEENSKGNICGLHRRWEQGQEKLPWVFCCSIGDETGGLIGSVGTEKQGRICRQP